MRNPNSKEVRIFCDGTTKTALVRIFKYRNYVWAGGKTLEFKKDSPELQRVFQTILKYSIDPIDKSSILWDETKDTATTYVLEMKK